MNWLMRKSNMACPQSLSGRATTSCCRYAMPANNETKPCGLCGWAATCLWASFPSFLRFLFWGAGLFVGIVLFFPSFPFWGPLPGRGLPVGIVPFIASFSFLGRPALAAAYLWASFFPSFGVVGSTHVELEI